MIQSFVAVAVSVANAARDRKFVFLPLQSWCFASFGFILSGKPASLSFLANSFCPVLSARQVLLYTVVPVLRLPTIISTQRSRKARQRARSSV